MNIELPTDLFQLSRFRQLRDHFVPPDPLAACYVWVALWSELGKQMVEGNPVGRLTSAGQESLTETLSPLGSAFRIEQILERLMEIGLLVSDGVDYVCPKFINDHAGKSEFRSQAQKGGDMKAFKRRMASLEGDAAQQGLLINEHKFVDAAGVALDRDKSNQVVVLIKACDNALFAPDRQTIAFTEGVIQNGLLVLERFSPEEINIAMTLIAKKRNHPCLMGITTEKLLPEFGNFVKKLE